MEEYLKYLENKRVKITESGFDLSETDLNPLLFPFQKYCVKKALKAGRYAIFANTGNGKTIMQIEFAQKVHDFTGQSVLIIAPLVVVGQTIQEGTKFGYTVTEIDNDNYQDNAGIYITNYEQIEKLDVSFFSGVVLDESSILKSFMGAYKQMIIDMFANTPYKLACTATPSPNDTTELCNHAEFLNVMSRNEMLAMYFVNDAAKTGEWRLKGHAVDSFYDFVAQWAVMINKPSDIGFSDDGYILPSLNIKEIKLETDKKENGKLFNDTAVSSTDHYAELRRTTDIRLEKTAEIANSNDERYIIWIKTDDEGVLLRKLIPDAVEVKGSDKKEYKRDTLLEFANGKHRVLITKLKIAAMGLNLQSCHNQIFPSIDFSFEQTYQGIRRSYRFGQTHEVNIHIISTDTMQNVVDAINKKEKSFMDMQKLMSEATTRNMNADEMLQSERKDMVVKTENATLMLGDCVQRIKEIPDNSIGFSVYSPPFCDLYTYSNELEDMGNSKCYQDFLFAFDLMVKDLYRILWNGRNIAVHCMDLPIQKGKEGYIGLRDFSGMIIDSFQKAGFIYHSRVTIWKNPVTEMQRTKALGLLHKQVKKDSAMCRVGIPDYVLIFRKDDNTDHEHPIHCDINVDTWQKYASPVWMDIDYSDTLNGREGRESSDEKHICPLQLPTIQRLIHLYSNKGDTVFTPFMGIGSEVYQALKMGRRGVGIELKTQYFNVACKNVKRIEQENSQPLLFGEVETEKEETLFDETE